MNLGKTLFILPNLLTSASLVCGMVAILNCLGSTTTTDDLYRSVLFVFYAFFFDLFDGRVARMTRTQSAFGVEYDSLADLVSFGVAPAVITYRWALEEAGWPGRIAAAVFVLAGGIRLARFNVLAHRPKVEGGSGKPGSYMLGLPIPMAAGFVVALFIAARAMGGWPWLTEQGFTFRGIAYPMMVAVLLILAFLMVSTVRFRSFKDLRPGKFSLALGAFIVGSSAVLWIYFDPGYILGFLIFSYLAMGFAEELFSFVRHGERPGTRR